MDDATRQLRSYYEAEAVRGSRNTLNEWRIGIVDEFIALLRDEGRRSVAELGAGPGLDGARFVAAGHAYTGIDLAHGNAVLAANAGVAIIQGDLSAIPLRRGAFDAGWSMSTLMHLPDADVPDALRGMVAVLRPGAPLLIGLWGGDDIEVIEDADGEQRSFSLRSHGRNHDLFSTSADVEWSTTLDLGPDQWEYQLFRLRTVPPYEA